MIELKPATELAALVRAGEVSAREVVEASLRAIERLDPRVNAFTALAPERALAEAARIRPGDRRPLCGVPVALKDFLTATAGLPTTHGSWAFGDWIADHDAAHVRHLREAGAIVLGKTTTPELAMRPVTESLRYGVTRNPWDLALTCGGSSGGSAAAVAAGMVPLADGSDFGGSIRIPASCCGVVGFRPSRGRISFGPDFGDPGAGRATHGVLARTVIDAATGLDAMAGQEAGDPHRAAPLAGTFAQAASRPPARLRVRLALVAPLGVPVDPDPADAARRAADRLAALGHEVDEAVPAWDDEELPRAWATFAGAVVQHLGPALARLNGGRYDPALLEPATREWLVEAPRVPAVAYLDAVEHLVAFARGVLGGWDDDAVLVTPTLTRLPVAAAAMEARAGVTDDAVRFSAFLRPWSITGQPAVSLPVHRTADGVPVGVQLVAAPGRDDVLFALAAQLEDASGATPWRAPPIASR